VNEPVRYHAASAILAQDDEKAVPALVSLLIEEESVRVRTKIAEGLASHGWKISETDRERVRSALPPPYSVNAEGRVVKAIG
jgi:HEAT repeat protein